ncbi:hypothetical protein NQ318_021979 [Aromia moschata]|uniref:DUF4817 domain-containing protein n=1 Tax=Aromia moschata TaxID=1265417 RepID=A0AAV8Z5J2_9CUCU|nr:hypothetical protein NQ318_021979 [Aromia moschata]
MARRNQTVRCKHHMIYIFAQANFNGHEATRRYLQLYPNRRQPNHKLFRNIYNRLGETGSFRPKSNHGTPKTVKNHILMTSTFTRRRVFNWRNNHLRDSENPQTHEFKVNIWYGVICNFTIGPFEEPPNLTGPQYLNFLRHHSNELLEDVPLVLRENMWFVHDRAPPQHFALPVRQYLHEYFPHRWIGRGRRRQFSSGVEIDNTRSRAYI